ncbi:MAG: ThiF family adenylyltransferase [Lysobacterales bacterium]
MTRLENLGFAAAPRIGMARCFDGTLKCRAGPVRVQLQVTDWDFVDYPVLRLLEHPPFLPSVVPHLSAGRTLCYFQESAVVLDRYRPDLALSQCLNRAQDELDRLAQSPTYREGEFQAEFDAVWAVGQHPAAVPLLVGNLDSDQSHATCFGLDDADGRRLVIASSGDDVGRLCSSTGWTLSNQRFAHCHVLSSSQTPSLPGRLPGNVCEMFAWLKSWDTKLYSALQGRLAEPAYLTAGAALFLVDTPVATFGLMFKLDAFQRQAYSNKPKGYRQFLHRHGSSQPVTRLSVTDISADYVHSRNLRHSSLKDRRVTLIGCGAIGGYVAQALVRLGAGSGSGRLTIVDPDLLTADNLGRHVLGFESLLRPKADALSEALRKQFPAAQITAEVRRADAKDDLTADIVINATGEEAVGLMLNDRHLQLSLENRPPLVHVWILGNGEAVQALMVDRPRFACFRCLRLDDDARTNRFPVLRDLPETRVRGCRAFRPYAVSAPMAAAALCTDLVIGWLEGDPSPRFRTRSVESADVRSVKNQDVAPIGTCPACRP